MNRSTSAVIVSAALAAFAAFAHPGAPGAARRGRPQTTADWRPDRTSPVKTGEFRVDLIVIAFPDCEPPPSNLEEVKRSLISIGRANFAAAETDPSAAGAQGGGFTVTDYYKEYSQGIAWPVFAVHPTFYMAPQPLGYYCRWDGESNPIGFKSDGAERARKLREDALRFVKSRGGLPPGGSFNCWVYCRKIAWTGPSSGAERSMRPYYRPLSPEEVEKGKKDPVFKYNPKIPWGDPLWPNSTIQVHYPGGGNVMVHEIGHCLGAPDFYHCTEEHDGVPGNPALKWAYGPTGPAYCRWKYQAFVPPNAYPTVKTSGTYKLGPRSGRFPASAAKAKPDMFPGAPEKPAPMPLGLYVPTTHPNYMLYLEYCRDEKPPVGDPDARGLIASVINTTMSSPMKGPPDLCYIYRRDDPESCKGLSSGSPYLLPGDSFTTNSNPAAYLPNRLPAGVYITNIRETPDGACLFDLEVAPPKLSKKELDFSLLPQTRLVAVDKAGPVSFRAELDVLYRGEPLKSEYGFCWGTRKDPDVRNRTGTLFPLHHRDRYEARIIDLQPGGTYFVRAYARNENGIRYSVNQKKITLPAPEAFAGRAIPPLFSGADRLLDAWYVKQYHFGRANGVYRNANPVLALLAIANYYRAIPGEDGTRASRLSRPQAARPAVGRARGGADAGDGSVDMEYVHSNPSRSRPRHRMKDVDNLIKRMTALARELKLLYCADFVPDPGDAAEEDPKKRRKKQPFRPSSSAFSARRNKFGKYSEWIENCAAKLKIKKPEETFFPCDTAEDLEKRLPEIKRQLLLAQPVMLVRESTYFEGETEYRWPLDIAIIDGFSGNMLHVVFPLGCDRGMKQKESGMLMDAKDLMDSTSGAVLMFYRPGPVPARRPKMPLLP